MWTGPAWAQATLTVDASQRYQTWEGMESATGGFHFDDPSIGSVDPVPQTILDEVLDDAVNNLGLSAIRYEVHLGDEGPNHGVIERVNDNSDPFVLDNSNIFWDAFDPYVSSQLIPFKQLVEARGDTFTLNLHAVAWDSWQWYEPASDPGQEYAEIMMACLDRLKNVFGIEPAYLTVVNEPGLTWQGWPGMDKDVVVRDEEACGTNAACRLHEDEAALSR